MYYKTSYYMTAATVSDQNTQFEPPWNEEQSRFLKKHTTNISIPTSGLNKIDLQVPSCSFKKHAAHNLTFIAS